MEGWDDIQLLNGPIRPGLSPWFVGSDPNIELRRHESHWTGIWWERDLPPLTVGCLPTSGQAYLSGSCPGYSSKKEVLLKVCTCKVGLSFSIQLNPSISLLGLWREQGLISDHFIAQNADTQNHLVTADID